MELLDIMNERFSVRKYVDKPVEPEKLIKFKYAYANFALPPISTFVKLLVVLSPESLEKLGKAANIYGAPVAVIVCADKTKAWKRPFDGMQTTDIDASILTDHMMLEAVEQGLGTVWICYFKPDVLKEEFKLPDSLEPINILAIGYADASVVKPAKDRIPVKELVEYL